MIEVCIYGRGGQGGVTLAELIAHATIAEGKHAQSMPSFGPERRGAPVLAFLRVDEHERIKIRSEIAEPDVLVVLDPGLLRISTGTTPLAQLKEEGIAVVNTKQNHEALKSELKLHRLATVDALSIARRVLGLPIVNTAMAGALVKATGIASLESLEDVMEKRFGKLAAKNREAMVEAYNETVVS